MEGNPFGMPECQSRYALRDQAKWDPMRDEPDYNLSYLACGLAHSLCTCRPFRRESGIVEGMEINPVRSVLSLEYGWVRSRAYSKRVNLFLL